MKNKEGRRTSHSYLSRTHGPKETTHGTSGKHPWWRGDSRRWFLPPVGRREEVCWCSRSRKRGGGGTEERSRKWVLSSRVSRDGEYIGEGGQPGGPPGGHAAPGGGPAPGGATRAAGAREGARAPPPWRGQPLGRARRAPGRVLVALWPHSGSSGRFFCADFLSDFSQIFGALFIWGKTEIEKQQKTGTGTVVH